MTKPRVYTMPFASVYPLYIQKALKKGRTKTEVDEIIRWLTGHSQQSLEAEIVKRTELEIFFADAPKLNPMRKQITGRICGVRVEEVKESKILSCRRSATSISLLMN